jgi:hypothetical protein
MKVGENERENKEKRIRTKVSDIMGESDLSEVLELMGAEVNDEAADAAMKAVMTQQMSEYAIDAMKEAKRHRTRVGAATIIIAASK